MAVRHASFDQAGMQYVLCVLAAFCAVGTIGHLFSCAAGAAFLFRGRRHRGVAGFVPPVTVLKPVRGLGEGDEENFRSFFRLDYPEYEILFLVHEDAGEDPSIPCIRRLIAENPGVKARILRTSVRTAVHEKVNNYLEGIEKAAHGVICITDADAYVDRDYLRRGVKPLSDPSVGLVTSLQTMNGFRCAATAFEGIPQNYDGLIYFLAAYAVGRMNSIYGHSVIFRKDDFRRVGAEEEIRDHILDDIALGIAFVIKGGLRVEIAPPVVHTRYPRASWRKVMAHILRWRRFQRAKTATTIALVFYFVTFWGIAAAALSAAVPQKAEVLGLPVRALGLGLGLAAVAVRTSCVLVSNLVAGDKKSDLRYLWTLFLYDPYAIYTTVASFFINSFEHAGRRFRVVGNRMRRVG